MVSLYTYSQLQLSWNLRMSVCPLKTLGQAGHFKNGWIWLKFGTLVPWVNIWGCFFSFFENFDFWGLGTSFSPKRGWQPGDFKNGPIWLKFCTLAHWVNTLGCVFHFFKIFIFGAWGRVLAPKRGWKLWGRLNTSKMIRFDWNFAHLLLNTWGHFSIFSKF